jgi:prephenate dehydrogenase
MAVAGVGLIGGSMALAARKRRLVKEIFGYGRGKENLRFAQRTGMIDGYALESKDVPENIDLLVLATPVQSTAEVAAQLLPCLRPGGIVTDVGSVKGKIVREIERLVPPNVSFVGGHPIAGTEHWGARAAFPELFIGQRCILTPTKRTQPKALRRLAAFWRQLGAKVELMDPDLHDRVLAMVSHLPHVLVYALVNTVGRAGTDSLRLTDYCAGGFKDFTRIASSRPELWRDICLANQGAIDRALRDYVRQLERLRRGIRTGDGRTLEREFASAYEVRGRMP